jgi:hypothetical protein
VHAAAAATTQGVPQPPHATPTATTAAIAGPRDNTNAPRFILIDAVHLGDAIN